MLAVGGYLAVSIWRDAPAPKPKAKPVVVAKPAQKAPPSPQVQRTAGPDLVPSMLMAQHGAGRAWHYSVSVQPQLWRDPELRYRVLDRGGEKVVDTQFLYAGGNMNFQLGTFAARHPSHANTRFPGFFLYPAYFDQPLDIGRRFAWEWPWQLPGGQIRPGRVKRFTAEVKEWTSLPAPKSIRAPMDQFPVARIEIRLSYVEDGVERASATETVWYAWRFLQVVKIVREGKTPDEAAHRVEANLIAHLYP
jgi:hypothetical protein